MIKLQNEKMSKHSTFKIGGIAENVYFPENLYEFKEIYSDEFIVIGNGSNILFGDRTIKSPIIITTKMNNYHISDECIIAECGAATINLAFKAAEKGLSGLEFAGGIPGTIGGCIYMNAGAHGGQMSDVVLQSQIMKENVGLRLGASNSTFMLNNKQHEFGYRTSVFCETKDIILQTTLKLKRGENSQIISKMKDNLERRKANQPFEFPSAGSIFKKVDGVSAGEIIDKCGLKGLTMGGAQVSPKHAGFIVNIGGATAQDVLNLIEVVKNEVDKKMGIVLHEEVRFID